MRSKIVGIVLGLGLVVATAAPSFACMYQDQAATDTQQKTAQAQGSDTTTTQ